MTTADRWESLGRAAAIAIAGIAVYLTSFSVPFVFDDLHRIVDNPGLRRLWPPGGWLNSTRPLVDLTFALDYALGGLSVWHYHAFNVALHVVTALLVADLARLVFEAAGKGWASEAHWLGWWAGLLFAVHPLQTEAVTYAVSRSELLMAFWYLATACLALRSFRAQGGKRRLLNVAAVTCCALGMASKEVMVTAPLMVMWLDLCLVEGGWRARFGTLRRHRALYLGLAGSWAVLAYLFSTGTYLGVGPEVGITPGQYLATQWGVITHYLRLYLWPSGLTLDYGWPVAKSWLEPGVILPMLLVLSLVLAAFWLLRVGQGVWAAWIGWTLGILVPTSTVYPIADVIFEHRMYLPLAGLAVLSVMSVAGLVFASGKLAVKRVAVVVGFGVVIILGAATAGRNQVWQDPISLWQDTVRKQPRNARALYTVGTLLGKTNRLLEAVTFLRRAVEIDPGYANAHTNLGNMLVELGRFDEAAKEYEAALRLRPKSAEDHGNLGNALLRLGRVEEARRHLELALSLRPDLAEPHNNLGILLAKTGEVDAAISHFRAAVRIRPDFVVARRNLAAILSLTGAHEEALEQYHYLLNANPRNPDLYYLTSLALVQAGRRQQAVDLLHKGLRSAGSHLQINNYLAWILSTSPEPEVRSGAEAVQLARNAVRATGSKDPNALDTLAAAYAETGKFASAIQTAREALELASRQSHSNLAASIKARLSLYELGKPYREE